VWKMVLLSSLKKANLYQISDEELDETDDGSGEEKWIIPQRGTGEVTLRRQNGKDGRLTIRLALLGGFGGMEIFRDDYNRRMSLPEGELPTGDYVRHTREIRMLKSVMLRAWQRRREADRLDGTRGYEVAPRVILWKGLSGTAKSTTIRSLRRSMGVSVHTINSSDDVKVSDLMVGIQLEGEKLQLGVREFLASVGRIRVGDGDWQRFQIPGETTSNRKVLFIDEANGSPELLYALAPLFRGEKKFTVEYGGEQFEVEVDNDVFIVLTFNPAETFAGRKKFPREVISNAYKLSSPNPRNYSKEAKAERLYEKHRRGIDKKRRELEEQMFSRSSEEILAEQEQRPSHEQVKPHIEFVDESKRHPTVKSLDEVLGRYHRRASDVPVSEPAETEEPSEDSGSGKSAKTRTVEIDIQYDPDEIISKANDFTENGGTPLDFANGVLIGYVQAISNGNRNDVLREAVLKAAQRLSPDVRAELEILSDMFRRRQLDLDDLKNVEKRLLALRTLFAARGIFLNIQLIKKEIKGKDRLYVKLYAQDILDRFEITDAHLARIGEDPSAYRDQPPMELQTKN